MNYSVIAIKDSSGGTVNKEISNSGIVKYCTPYANYWNDYECIPTLSSSGCPYVCVCNCIWIEDGSIEDISYWYEVGYCNSSTAEVKTQVSSTYEGVQIMTPSTVTISLNGTGISWTSPIMGSSSNTITSCAYNSCARVFNYIPAFRTIAANSNTTPYYAYTNYLWGRADFCSCMKALNNTQLACIRDNLTSVSYTLTSPLGCTWTYTASGSLIAPFKCFLCYRCGCDIDCGEEIMYCTSSIPSFLTNDVNTYRPYNIRTNSLGCRNVSLGSFTAQRNGAYACFGIYLCNLNILRYYECAYMSPSACSYNSSSYYFIARACNTGGRNTCICCDITSYVCNNTSFSLTTNLGITCCCCNICRVYIEFFIRYYCDGSTTKATSLGCAYTCGSGSYSLSTEPYGFNDSPRMCILHTPVTGTGCSFISCILVNC